MRKYRGSLTLLAIYALAWWPRFTFTDLKLWEDWILVSVSRPEVRDYFTWIGRPFWADLHLGILGIGFWAYAVVTFVAWFAAGLIFRKILDHGLGLSRKHSFVAAAMFLVMPFATTRVMALVTPFVLGVLVFVAAWLWLVSRAGRFRLVDHIGTFVLLIASYTTPSLLVFVTVPIAHLFYMESATIGPSLAAAWGFIKRHWLLLLSPVIYWIPNRLLFQPIGYYAGYNTVGHLASMSKKIAFYGVIVIALALLVLLVISWRKNFARGGRAPSDSSLALITGYALFAAVIPYLAVGDLPSRFFGYEDRLQLLLPFGVAMACALVYRRVECKRLGVARAGFAIAVIGSIILTNLALSVYTVEYRKQNEIIGYLKTNRDIEKSPVIIIDDQTSLQNSPYRNIVIEPLPNEYSPWEISAWAEVAYSTRSHLGTTWLDLPWLYYDNHKQPKFASSDAKLNNTGNIINISSAAGQVWPFELLNSKPLVIMGHRHIPALDVYIKGQRKKIEGARSRFEKLKHGELLWRDLN